MPSMQRWDAGSDVVRFFGVLEFLEQRTGFVRLDLLGPDAGPFLFLAGEMEFVWMNGVRIGRPDELTPVRA